MDTENNFLEFLSQTHYDFMVGFLELERQREAAVMNEFLEKKS
jgi:hypothetical protein